MKAKAIKSTGLACVALMLASCASGPYHGNNGYGGGGGYINGNSGGRKIDVAKTTALVAAGVAGLSLYHYSKEKDKRKKAERAHARHHPVSNYGYHNGYGYNRDYNRRGGW